MNFCVCSMLPFLLNNLLTLFSFHFSLENICFSCYYKGFCDFTGVEESSNSFCMKYSVIWIISLLKRQCREIFTSSFFHEPSSPSLLLLAFLLFLSAVAWGPAFAGIHVVAALLAFFQLSDYWTIGFLNSGLANWSNDRSIGLRPQNIGYQNHKKLLIAKLVS